MERVTIWGLCGCGKTCCTVCTLALAMAGGVDGYVVLLGDGTLEDKTLGDVPALARRLDRGEPLPATLRLNDFAFTVHRTADPDDPMLVRWIDPQGEWARRSSCGGEAPTDKELAELVQCLRESGAVLFVLHPLATNVDQQLELLLRGLDQIAPRFERRTGLEPLSVAVVMTHWAQIGGPPEKVLDTKFPGAMARLRIAPVRLGVFGVENYGPNKADAAAAMKFVLDGVYHASAQRTKRQVREAAQERERKIREADDERRRRRGALLRRVVGGALVAGALLGLGGGAVAGHDRALVRRAENRVAALAPEDLDGHRAAWAEVEASRWIPVGHRLSWLEPGQDVAARTLADLALEPSRRAFLTVLDAPTPWAQVIVAASFIEHHGGSPFVVSAHQAARAAAVALAEVRDLPAGVDPELVARTLETVFLPNAWGDDAAALRRACARLRGVAAERAGEALVARLDGREAGMAGQATVAPLGEEEEARAFLAKHPDRRASAELRRRLERLEALRLIQSVAAEVVALPNESDPACLDEPARRVAVAATGLQGSPLAAEAAAAVATIGRVRAELVKGAQITAALASSGQVADRVEEDVVLLARVAGAHPDHPRIGAVWSRIGDLLAAVDRRVRAAAPGDCKAICLPSLADFVIFEATTRLVQAIDPARFEVARRILDHHLRAALLRFRCKRCQVDTRGAVHEGCRTLLVFRDGRAMCPSHPTLTIRDGGDCRGCGYAWEETR